MRSAKRIFVLIVSLLLLFSCQPWLLRQPPSRYSYKGMSKEEIKLHKKVEAFLTTAQTERKPLPVYSGTRIDSLVLDKNARQIDVYLDRRFSFIPFRPETVKDVYANLRKRFGHKYKDYKITLYSLLVPIEELVPNFFRKDTALYDRSRLPKKKVRPLSVKRPQWPWRASRGLTGRNIVLWNSHGWYFNLSKKRWEWQRPRLFQTVEDLLSTSFVLPYLVPMLENAGATVFVPRERDIQFREVIVDNDSTPPSGKHYSEVVSDNRHFWETGASSGFGYGQPPYPTGLNPFEQGTYRQVRADSVPSARIRWTPNIPATGEYAVYVSYHADSGNVSDARYSVFHLGGRTDFVINQQIGGSTWLYLGTFKFRKGLHPDSGSVLLTNQSTHPGRMVTADAVRFGGGMGIIARDGSVSGRPRFEEAARYYLQFAGMPDSLVYSITANTNDYRDDYVSRGKYVNYLYGRPFGPKGHRDVRGLGIPVDLSFAFHTDAGFTQGDTTIGTLAIYSLVGSDSQRTFPDSVSRLACRDFADIVQTQVVHDIRATFDSTWQRRPLFEGDYSEVYLPNVPAMILETLSHQNFRDMQMALDPRFRFTVARAIYKAMLKFLASEHRQPYVVQPLPVTHFRAVLDSAGKVILRWQAKEDPLEPTARPERYIVYTRIDSGGFDNGVVVSEPEAVIGPIPPGKIYSFKVCALNAGGKSFPSEILAVYRAPQSKGTVLIVNGFDRICGPSFFSVDSIGGFVALNDNGVPDRYDVSFTGMQYDFNRRSPFISNDAPGFGASFADMETKVIPGNTFDFAYVHGLAVKHAGYSFCSVSDESVMDEQVELKEFGVVDLILGEEKTTPWPQKFVSAFSDSAFKAFPLRLQKALRGYLKSGGALFVSGAYVGSDLWHSAEDKRFARKMLHVQWVNSHASRSGEVRHALGDSLLTVAPFRFNTAYHPQIYTVEAPDAIDPVQGAWTWLRYAENGQSAAIAYRQKYKCVVMGFPFETILAPENRDAVMRKILSFLRPSGK